MSFLRKCDNLISTKKRLTSIITRYTGCLYIDFRKRSDECEDIKESGFTKIKFVGNQIKRADKFIGSTNQVSPHWRRGHWKNQKFGELFQDTKLIWIMPTIVNKDKGNPVNGHIYSVTE